MLVTKISIIFFFWGAAEEATDLGENSFVLNDPNNNAAFLPFGSGIRACVGQKFVIQGVAALFASLLKKYEVFSMLLSFISLELLTDYYI